ncbi:hypothetical protein ACFW9D_05960 [Streptomyces sp. NPDC059524]|uniref:hypothetical protein n=1 Tax=Streptomyces sp. NPDC059524 TaxID=3346856 RepID=UPI00369DB02D
MTDTTPADELRTAAQTLLDLADDTAEDMATNDYWRSAVVEPKHWFHNGIDNAVGGPAGKLAGLMSPRFARMLAIYFRDEAGRGQDFDTRAVTLARVMNGGQP